MSIQQYFTKVSTAEEAIPQEWKDSPLPPARKKRAVGRPRKRGDIQSEIPVPVPVDIESEVVDVERPADTVKPESPAADKPTPKRGKYKSFSVKEKLDILAESDIWCACYMQTAQDNSIYTARGKRLISLFSVVKEAE